MRLEVSRGPGAETCPGDEVLHDVLASRMSWDPIDPAAPARMLASLSKRGRVFMGHVEIRSAAGATLWQRELDPLADCSSVVEGLGFVAALRLDPAGPPAGRSATSTTSPIASASPSASPTLASPTIVAPPALPIESWPKIQIGLAGGVGFGVSPAPVAGMGALSIGARWPILSIELEARAFPISSGAGSSGASITTGLFVAAAIGCGHWKALAGCGVLDVGALRATAPADHPVTAVVASVRAGVRGGVELPLSEVLAIRVTGDALLPFQRPGLKLDGATVWTAPIVSGGVQGGIVVTF